MKSRLCARLDRLQPGSRFTHLVVLDRSDETEEEALVRCPPPAGAQVVLVDTGIYRPGAPSTGSSR